MAKRQERLHEQRRLKCKQQLVQQARDAVNSQWTEKMNGVDRLRSCWKYDDGGGVTEQGSTCWNLSYAPSGEHEEDDDSADEERTLAKLDRVVSDLSDDTAKAAAKLTRTKSLSSVTPDQELAAMQKVYKSMKDSYKPVFKNLATVEKLDPKQAAANWGIWDKLKTKTMDQLASDPLYLFWMKYKKFWNKEWNKA
ncbi:hypothetical protein Pcac1_g2463 [Phytophthora cactorum]|nr:hypothetical protein Pcac1_g2463 [Phytophthora cactorum]KAG2923698.1 hypothetical protein PC117_g15657 [Phytophthora cactorum]